MNCNIDTVGANIRNYGRAVHTRLELIKAVEDTVDALSKEQIVFTDLFISACEQVERIHACTNDGALDPEGSINELLINAETALQAIYHNYKYRLLAANACPHLGDHKDDVVNEYTTTLELISDLHETTEEMRWAIKEHDADLSKPTGKFDNAEDLIAHLKAL